MTPTCSSLSCVSRGLSGYWGGRAPCWCGRHWAVSVGGVLVLSCPVSPEAGGRQEPGCLGASWESGRSEVGRSEVVPLDCRGGNPGGQRLWRWAVGVGRAQDLKFSVDGFHLFLSHRPCAESRGCCFTGCGPGGDGLSVHLQPSRQVAEGPHATSLLERTASKGKRPVAGSPRRPAPHRGCWGTVPALPGEGSALSFERCSPPPRLQLGVDEHAEAQRTNWKEEVGRWRPGR